MKRAFTLIELLVVIAIIAILAAILFPVFAQARESAQQTQSLSNARQTGTAMLIYAGDYNDLLPNANFASGWTAAPEYLATTVNDIPGNWRSDLPAWVDAHNSVFPNNVIPYMRNWDILASAGNPDEATLAGQSTALLEPFRAGLTMNGFLSGLSQSQVQEVSRLPMLWYGRGAQNLVGYSSANPRLGCLGPANTPCRFNPGGLPTGAGSAFGADLGGATFNMAVGGPPVSAYVHRQGQIFVSSDTSARYVRLANPNTENNLTFTDPYANYDNRGVGTGFYPCRIEAGDPGYSCIFRPDFDFNYDNWF